ncbi:molybdopterin-binding protein [Ruegeria hyattellae]|uniref:molybdopterin-binding protein n=1 Tax=Ruegeria hyattellae TaxID=3233337 RepID=UPI00355B5C22
MKFGPVPVAEAAGAILAHSVSANTRKLRKGLVLGEDELSLLTEGGVQEVTVARLEPGDVHEDAAAQVLADALVPDPAAANVTLSKPFTGRVNILAASPGIVDLDVAAVERFNQVHPMITVATVPPYQQMTPRGMVATIKVISYAVPEIDVTRAADAARSAIRLIAPVYGKAGLIVSDIPGGPSNDKGIAAIRGRVEALGMDLSDIRTVPHREEALSAALHEITGDMVLILTGSATSDPQDVAPAALRNAGGRVDRFGMPVDPGNLLFLGQLGPRPVIGLPGCARAPALNGADWVLSRVACGITTTGADIAAMGVGGLLKEIPTRPQPRLGKKRS